jgi:uncharacterized glyoxalase superfamily protein PhnB
VPYVLYRDPAGAARWISQVLGFREAFRFTVPDGGPVRHIELERNGAVLILGRCWQPFGETARRSLWSSSMMSMPRAARIPAAGGTVLDRPTSQAWGLRQAVVADAEGQAGNSPSTSVTSHPCPANPAGLIWTSQRSSPSQPPTPQSDRSAEGG